ncbi:MAG: hypothetical protein WD295_04950, partial [Bacteroidota bacterium]
YARSLDDARPMSAALKRGASFDSLFATREDSSARTMETTILNLERDNPDLARELANLPIHHPSEPIAGPDGFYIVRIDRMWQNPLLTQSAEDQYRHQAISIVTAAKADERAREYVRGKMVVANPVLKAEGFNIVRAYIAEKGLSKDRRVEWQIPATFMTEAGPRPISISPQFLGNTLVTMADHAFTVRDFIRWYDIRQLQLNTRSPEAFASSLKQAVWKMVQDGLLSREAFARGFHLQDTVTYETKKWEAKLLYLAGRSHLLRTIVIPETDVRARFEEYTARTRDKGERSLDFDSVEREIRLELYAEEELRVLHRTIQRLRREYSTEVDEAAVQRLQAQLPPDPSPIDVIFYKPGGTFPRRAFPTIDEQWIIFH